jgi:hypothetical protein
MERNTLQNTQHICCDTVKDLNTISIIKWLTHYVMTLHHPQKFNSISCIMTGHVKRGLEMIAKHLRVLTCVSIKQSAGIYVFYNLSIFTVMSTYSYCMFMYLHHASSHSSATPTEVFPSFFLSCKANARVKPTKMGYSLHSSKISVLFYVLFVLCHSVYCVCVNVYCTTATGWLPNCS